MKEASDYPTRYGIVLAAGEGKRLQPLVRRLRGDALPKQYVSFIGPRSMLEDTFDRVELLLPRERVFTVVGEHHLNFPGVGRQLAGRLEETIIKQPENKDTGPGVLLPLMHVYKRQPEATVAVFPSDHFVLEGDLFMKHVSLAFHAVERNPSLFVLLGIEPSEPEPEYGYILPKGDREESSSGLTIRRVRRFVEKPDSIAARELILNGGLWNTMVMVFRVKTLLDIVRDVDRELYASFEEIRKAIGTRDETSRVKEIYRRLKPSNFSKGIIEPLPARHPSCLSTLAVRGVLWSDWGLPRSIERVLRKIDYREPASDRMGAAAANRLWKIFRDGLPPSEPRGEKTTPEKESAAPSERFAPLGQHPRAVPAAR